MLQRVPTYLVTFGIGDSELRLRVPADRVEYFVSILLYNRVTKIEMSLEDPNGAG